MKDTETNENSIDENLPQLVSGAGHDALAMSKIAKVKEVFYYHSRIASLCLQNVNGSPKIF